MYVCVCVCMCGYVCVGGLSSNTNVAEEMQHAQWIRTILYGGLFCRSLLVNIDLFWHIMFGAEDLTSSAGTTQLTGYAH